MALDEPSEKDEIFHEEGFAVVVEKHLLQRLGGVRIDFETSRWMGARFSVVPLYQPASSCC